MFFKNDGAARSRIQLPTLPLRDIVVFPHMVSQLFVGREKSIAALDAAMEKDKEILLVAQKNASTDEPSADEIFDVGTIGTIVQMLRLADGTVKVLVEGRRRATITRFLSQDDFFLAEAEPLEEELPSDLEVEALVRSVQNSFEIYVKLNRKVQPEVVMSVQSIDDPSRLSDTIAANLPTIKLTERHGLLAMLDVKQRLEKLYHLLQGEVEILQVEKKIRSRVKKQMERSQKEFYLNEQMQAIQKELGGGEKDGGKSDLDEIDEALAKKALSAEARERVKKEAAKLKQMHPTSAEASVARNYIDWILSLPWGERSQEHFELGEAEAILDEDHYGLEKCKERVLEYLAVQALTKNQKSPILCLVGPPGVGKTSIARSLARATGRKFVRLSLGGVRDEAEIRGHRRTYIGALPGKLIQNIKKVGTQNPVFLLDEIDKMNTDFRGDPASALLEVLDPEQNTTFNDHYLDLDYDLSEVMFITTANSLYGIPGPLRDRMEIIELSSYTEPEKLAIANKYLVPRNLKECGLQHLDVSLSEGALRELIQHYTKEAGVRNLDRQISALVRKVALEALKNHRDLLLDLIEVNQETGADEETSAEPTKPEVLRPQRRETVAVDPQLQEVPLNPAPESQATAEGAAEPQREQSTPSEAQRRELRSRARQEIGSIRIQAGDVVKMLGPEKFRSNQFDDPSSVGLTHGLSVSDLGGDLLDCEASVVAGSGKLEVTGLLEKGMTESAKAALSYIRSRASQLGLDADFYEKKDLHVHFPEFIKKDGPSAGVTMATCIASAFTDIPVRHDLAMTGEITLRGRVMPIGGLKEKLLAAQRNAMSAVLVPIDNKKDLAEVPRIATDNLKIYLVRHMDQVLTLALRLENPAQLLGVEPGSVELYQRPPEADGLDKPLGQAHASAEEAVDEVGQSEPGEFPGSDPLSHQEERHQV
ncbi:MAG: endopeptidase La [Polyangiaceae bacterium]|nr:endopeptidase La [Polyangiaceae bacterium]